MMKFLVLAAFATCGVEAVYDIVIPAGDGFPNCSVSSSYIYTPVWGDGYCDAYAGLNTAACGWDGGDCCLSTCVSPPGTEYYYSYTNFSYYTYDSENPAEERVYDICGTNYREQRWDENGYSDTQCADPNATDYVLQGNLTCEERLKGVWHIIEDGIGDGLCQEYLYGVNSAVCGWDGGDCCESTCVTDPNAEHELECGAAGYFCHDVDATDYGFVSTACVNFAVDGILGDGTCHTLQYGRENGAGALNGLVDLNTSACNYDDGDCLQISGGSMLSLGASALSAAVALCTALM